MSKQEHIVHLAVMVSKLRRALQKIADLPLNDHPKNAGRTDTRLRARRIAVAALKDN
jgi:hypothetical protein